jgi:hypothetical protein
MRNTLIILALCVLAIAVGAYLFLHAPKDLSGTNTDQAAAGTASVQEASVSFVVIEAGSNAMTDTRKNVAARDEASLARLWQMAHGDGSAPPAIDFDTEYVIGVFAGQKSSGGHTIEVQSVSDLGDTRTLTVAITSPGPTCIVTQAFTSPYQLIRVPVSMHYLRAEDTSVVSDCN